MPVLRSIECSTNSTKLRKGLTQVICSTLGELNSHDTTCDSPYPAIHSWCRYRFLYAFHHLKVRCIWRYWMHMSEIFSFGHMRSVAYGWLRYGLGLLRCVLGFYWNQPVAEKNLLIAILKPRKQCKDKLMKWIDYEMYRLQSDLTVTCNKCTASGGSRQEGEWHLNGRPSASWQTGTKSRYLLLA